MKNVELKILWGLPGSGKTHFANTFKEIYPDGYYNEHEKHHVVHVDDIWKSDTKSNYSQIIEKISKGIIYYLTDSRIDIYFKYHPEEKRIIVIDSLITTNALAKKVIGDILKYIDNINGWKYIVDVTIHVFDLDRESCIYNDTYRRNTDSTNTIMHYPWEEPNLPYSVVHHSVVRKPDWVMWMHKCNLKEKIESEKWLIARASGGNCWGDDAEEENVNVEIPAFEELDVLLELYVPNVTHTEYLKFFKEYVKEKEYTTNEYYGNYSTYKYYECKTEDLYRFLKECGKLQ